MVFTVRNDNSVPGRASIEIERDYPIVRRAPFWILYPVQVLLRWLCADGGACMKPGITPQSLSRAASSEDSLFNCVKARFNVQVRFSGMVHSGLSVKQMISPQSSVDTEESRALNIFSGPLFVLCASVLNRIFSTLLLFMARLFFCSGGRFGVLAASRLGCEGVPSVTLCDE